jgi:hypothetical protein
MYVHIISLDGVLIKVSHEQDEVINSDCKLAWKEILIYLHKYLIVHHLCIFRPSNKRGVTN